MPYKNPLTPEQKSKKADAQRKRREEAKKLGEQKSPKINVKKKPLFKIQAPKVEAPKVEAPKVEAPKIEAPEQLIQPSNLKMSVEGNPEKSPEQKPNIFYFPGVENIPMNKTMSKSNEQVVPLKNSIDYFEAFKVGSLFLTTTSVILLFYFQTLPLYKASKFHDPIFAAVGSLMILFGFAAAKAVQKSFLTTLMCLCVLFYEFALCITDLPKRKKS